MRQVLSLLDFLHEVSNRKSVAPDKLSRVVIRRQVWWSFSWLRSWAFQQFPIEAFYEICEACKYL